MNGDILWTQQRSSGVRSERNKKLFKRHQKLTVTTVVANITVC